MLNLKRETTWVVESAVPTWLLQALAASIEMKYIDMKLIEFPQSRAQGYSYFLILQSENLPWQVVAETGVPLETLSEPLLMGFMADPALKPDVLFLVSALPEVGWWSFFLRNRSKRRFAGLRNKPGLYSIKGRYFQSSRSLGIRSFGVPWWMETGHNSVK